MNIDIEDTLQGRVDNAIEEVENELRSYLKDNPEVDSVPCLNNDLDYSGAIHEIVDSAVPIYTKEIKDTWYLHDDKLTEAYENAGVGDNPKENDGMSAIYFYIQQEVNNWYQREASDIVDEVVAARKTE
jgi:hypothetical protein